MKKIFVLSLLASAILAFTAQAQGPNKSEIRKQEEIKLLANGLRLEASQIAVVAQLVTDRIEQQSNIQSNIDAIEYRMKILEESDPANAAQQAPHVKNEVSNQRARFDQVQQVYENELTDLLSPSQLVTYEEEVKAAIAKLDHANGERKEVKIR